jgi:hypothetical protein
LIYNKRNLKIRKGQSESVNRRTDNKWTKQKEQTIIRHWVVFSTSMSIPLVSSNSSAHNTFKQNTHHTKKKTRGEHRCSAAWTFSMAFTVIQNCNQSTSVYLFSKIANIIAIICWFVFFSHSVKVIDPLELLISVGQIKWSSNIYQH